MDLKQVCQAVGLKKTAIYKWMNTGEFPKPITIGRSVRWISTEVESCIDEKVRTSRENRLL
ncbi:helix-turn-helix transcriptional regulator [Lelliottia amnigena]|uniref:helix-turn-helix transcriptional regulator n=1 Tax=Lelliottia amnigena TaxID=61646 RepID=UPI001F43FDFE|nr:AlpA family phage regulatory protein [Lelliottia amnigena]